MSSIQADQDSFLPSNREATIASQATEESTSAIAESASAVAETTQQAPSQLVSTLDAALGNLERNLSEHQRIIRANLGAATGDVRPTSMASSTFSDHDSQDRSPIARQSVYSDQPSGPDRSSYAGQSGAGFSSGQGAEEELATLRAMFDQAQELMRKRDGRFKEALKLVEDLSARCAFLMDEVERLKSVEANLTGSIEGLKTAHADHIISLNNQVAVLRNQVEEYARPHPDPEAERIRQREAALELENKARQEAVDRQKGEILQARQAVMTGARMSLFKSPTSAPKPVFSRIDVVNGALNVRWGDWKTGMGNAAPPMNNMESIVAVRSEKVGAMLHMVFVTPKREIRMALDNQTDHKLWIDVRDT